MMDIIDGFPAVSQIVKRCIREEMVKDGLLEDVNTFIPSYRNEGPVEEPAIWLFEQQTTVVEGDGRLSKTLKLRTPFEFACLVYDGESLEESELKGKELAGRVAASIGKNFTRADDKGNPISAKPIFDSLNPIGAVEINEQSDMAVVTSVTIIVEFTVNWVISCIKKNGDNNG